MNTLLVGDLELTLNNEEYNLINSGNIIININGTVIINDINNTKSDSNYIINMNDNSNLIYKKYDKYLNNDINITINNNDNSIINYCYGFTSLNDSKLNILSNINGNNINSNIKIKGVTEKQGNINIIANANVRSNTHNNIINEDLRILKLNDGNVILKPNLCVSSDDLFATHNSTCGGFDKNELFYLETKGISKRKAQTIIKQGFINSDLNLDI